MSDERQFFDQIADRWDDIRSLNADKIRALIAKIRMQPGESVLDVGSGTGVLMPFLKEAVGESGSITAIDFSAQMIKLAARKYQDLQGINYVAGDIMEFEPPKKFNTIVCLNFFPHVKDKPRFIEKMRKMLVSGGCLVIMHDISRQEVNTIHGSCDAVSEDRLPAAAVVAGMLEEKGYQVADLIDDPALYFIKAVNSNIS